MQRLVAQSDQANGAALTNSIESNAARPRENLARERWVSVLTSAPQNQ